MIKWQRLNDPAAEPITLAEAKEHLRAEDSFTEEDDLIESMISAARDYAEKYCNRSWASANFLYEFDRFPLASSPFFLLDPGITSVDSITYVDTDGDIQTIDDSTYSYNATRQIIITTAAWPTDFDTGLVVVVESGPDHSASPSPVFPNSVKMAIKLILTDFYENRAGKTDVNLYQNLAVEGLLHPYRVGLGI